jgi:two-component system sensor histidine kinase/response regulator
MHRGFLITVSAVVGIAAATISLLMLLLGYTLQELLPAAGAVAAGGGGWLLFRRGHLRWGAGLLFLLSLAAIMLAHLLHGQHALNMIIISGAYIILILLGGALFSSRGALAAVVFLSLYSTLVSYLHFRQGFEEALTLIPLLLAEYAAAAGILYYLIRVYRQVAGSLRSAAAEAGIREEELRKSEARFRRFLESAPIAVFILDENRRYTFVNRAAEEMTGYSREVFLNASIPNVLSPADQRDRHLSLFQELMSKNSISLETRFTAKEGSVMDVLVNAVRLDEHQYMVFATDISERTRHEAELREAYRLAEEANKAKSEFLHTISHEVRTPLNTIIGMAEIMEQLENAPQYTSYIESVELSAYSLLGIFDEILDFSRIESGNIRAEYAELDLFSLAEEALKPIILKAKEKDLKVHCVFDPRLPSRVMGDYVHMKQILTHLLHNAVKFTVSGEVTFSMQAAETPHGTTAGPGRQAAAPADNQTPAYTAVEFTVEDTGIGIAHNQQAEIFQLFRQADNSSTKQYGGIGLGLTVCKNLTELLGGTLSFSSTPGIGSTFTFSLTLSRLNEARPAMPGGSIQNVIVCTGDEENQRQLSVLLDYYGYGSRYVSGSGECVRMMEESEPHPACELCIVELDRLMQNGQDTPLGAYLRDRDAPAGKLIALVPLFWEGIYSQVKERYGLSGYMVQPITPPKLLSVLNAAERD